MCYPLFTIISKGGIVIALRKIISEKNKYLTEQINSIRTQISNLPPGKLICTRNGVQFKWYQSLPKKLIYIPKKEQKLAIDLAYKNYLSLKLEDLVAEQDSLLPCIQHYSTYHSKADDFLLSSSESSRLSQLAFPIDSESLQEWKDASYVKNPNYPGDLKFKTGLGFSVRSKSEALIAVKLNEYKIPFHYEEKLVLGNREFYPDFTIRHPLTGKYYYLEHLGLMDDPKYSRRNFSKLQYYNSHGLVINQNLIITTETKDQPLDVEFVDKLIHHFFLD